MLMPFTVEQLDLLYKNAKDPVYFMRQNGDTFDYMYVNSVCFTLFNKELVGTNLDESMPPSLSMEIKNSI
ncbi:hypothetical protein B481_1614 [Planococcus halocryophilus Or1]|nr:hypothetical protein B481_1614 [Planococcus halocryophilus Or1]